MKRRHWVGGVAAAAALAGTAAALWQVRRSAETRPPDVWSLRFPRPNGGALVFGKSRGRRLLLNFWATWCPPCVTEMPLLNRFAREHDALGWTVAALAVDQAEPVRLFLERRPVVFEVGIAGFEGIELSRRLGNLGAALPFTVVFETDGSVLHRKLGALDPADLTSWGRAAA